MSGLLKNVDFRNPTTLEPNISYPQDKVIQSVLNKIKTRADIGMIKYGTSMERKDISTLEWLKHAQEEAMDLANYLERLIQDVEKSFLPIEERPAEYFA